MTSETLSEQPEDAAASRAARSSSQLWAVLLTAAAACLCLLGVAGAFFIGRAVAAESPQSGAPLVVRTLAAQAVAGYETQRSYIGRVQPKRRSELGFELAGQLTSLSVDDGDRVEAGQVLAELDTDRLRARRAELIAAKQEAQAQADLAGITYRRVSETFDQGAATPRELDEARERHNAARAAVRRRQRQIESVDVDLDKSTLRAPFEAVVAQRLIDEGRVVRAGSVVFALLERKDPEVRIGLPPKVASALSLGQRLGVRVHGRSYAASLKRLLPVTSTQTRTVEAVLILEASMDGLREGDLARVSVPQRIDQRGFWLPLTALSEANRGLWACYVAEPIQGDEPPDDDPEKPTHRLTRRAIEVLHTQADRAFVSGTLRDGELVVAEGLHRLIVGLKVRLAEPGGNSTDQTPEKPADQSSQQP